MHISTPSQSATSPLLAPHESFSWGIFRVGCYVSGTCHVISTGIGRERNLEEGKEGRRQREARWEERRAPFTRSTPLLLFIHPDSVFNSCSFAPFLLFFLSVFWSFFNLNTVILFFFIFFLSTSSVTYPHEVPTNTHVIPVFLCKCWSVVKVEGLGVVLFFLAGQTQSRDSAQVTHCHMKPLTRTLILDLPQDQGEASGRLSPKLSALTHTHARTYSNTKKYVIDFSMLCNWLSLSSKSH